MRVVFLGTPSFAVPTLEALAAAGHDVVCVVTQPDRPRGRGQQITPSPVKAAALRVGLPVYQPEGVRRPQAVHYLAALQPDAMVVVGYGQLISHSAIDIPPHGIINVHGSLLPKYRGAGPVQWAIANGETRTGVTTMRIDAGLDTGDMLLRAETEIGPEENAVELGARLAGMGAALLIETLANIASIAPPRAGPRAGHLRAAAEKGRWADRLASAGAGHPQSRARIPTLARSVYALSRPAIAYLEIPGGDDRGG